ncbi:MAG: triose-phosphate isomerase [Minwuia sp.]|uniref:triose-phosphate isomerase n=1 Tax=Minwuia sp. TaxID=2493630 RepID=UPI003A855F19
MLIAGNWKMNGSLAAVREFADAMAEGIETAGAADLLVCPPSVLIHPLKGALAKSGLDGRVAVGAQDCHAAASGAHTGDISAEMAADGWCSHVIVGHSERRTDHGETDAVVKAKAEAVLRAGLVAIVCIGETESERKSGFTNAVLARQIRGSLPEGATAMNTVIAYEPVWAIGTGLTPSLEDIEAAHAHIRAVAGEAVSADDLQILYGGSVKPGNAKEILGIGGVDGALVGGASLKAADFLGIASAVV